MSNQIKQASRPPRQSRTSGRRLAREMNQENSALRHSGKENGERRRAAVQEAEPRASKSPATVQEPEPKAQPKAGLLARMKAAFAGWKESDGASESPVVLGWRAAAGGAGA